MPSISARGFTFTYPGAGRPALKDVGFTVERGEVVGVAGPPGAGKTTLCLALAGFAPRMTGGQASGHLLVGGADPRQTASDEMAGRIGVVFEDYAGQLTQFKVLDEVTAPLTNGGMPREEAELRARALLERAGLADEALLGRRTWELSGGEQQRLAIAAALAVDPEVLVLDNVMDVLDPGGRREIARLIADLAGEKTLVVVTRDTEFLVRHTDKLLVLAGGEVVAFGPSGDLARDPACLASADLEPPAALRVAQALGRTESPLTAEELERSLGRDARRWVSAAPPAAPAAPAAPMGQPDTPRSEAAAAAARGAPMVQVRGVTYRYPDGTTALEDVHLEVRRGEVHGILGATGSGRTTLIRLVGGLLKPTRGEVVVGGTDTRGAKIADLAQIVGTVLANPDEQISERTVKEEIAFPLRQRRYRRSGPFSREERFGQDEIDERVERARALAGLDEALLEEDPILLPRGRRKVVTIAAALVLDPAVLVLDEPSVGFGAEERRRLRELLGRLGRSDKAVVVVDNDVDLVCAVAATVTVLLRGRVVLQGARRDVFAQRNWDALARAGIEPPPAARLAVRLGTEGLVAEDLIARLRRQPSGAP